MITYQNTQGKLELIIGPMFAGKTTELMRLLNLYSEMNLKVLYVNSIVDSRNNNNLSTHNPILKTCDNIKTKKTHSLKDIHNEILDYDVIGVDEAQFFSDLYSDVITLVENYHKIIIIAGLDTDYQRNPFGDIIKLIGLCDSVKKLNPFCKPCRDNNIITFAIFTKKYNNLNQNSNQHLNQNIDIGGYDKYYPVCRKCYIK